MTVRLLAAVVVVAAACAGPATDSADPPVTGIRSEVETPGAAGELAASPEARTGGPAGPVETEDQTGAEASQVDSEPAPDFTLALGDGGEFTLSAEARPVYLIFWAEW